MQYARCWVPGLDPWAGQNGVSGWMKWVRPGRWRTISNVKLSTWTVCQASGLSRLAQIVAEVLLFFHGGGYCSGSIVSHRRMVTEAGRAAGIRTLAMGYRLAPEHPFPASFQDALTAWRCLRKPRNRRPPYRHRRR